MGKMPGDCKPVARWLLARFREKQAVLMRHPYPDYAPTEAPKWTATLAEILRQYGEKRREKPKDFLRPFTSRELKRLQEVVDRMERMYPEELEGVNVHLGHLDRIDTFHHSRGPDVEGKPESERKGGRYWNHPRSTLLAKLLKYPSIWWAGMSEPTTPLTNIVEAPYYFPASDTVVVSTADPSLLEHELGHAVDFNRRRFGGRLGRDLYELSSYLPFAGPFVTLMMEQRANRLSEEAARRALKGRKLDEHLLERQALLGAGIASYAPKIPAHLLGTLAGLAVGAGSAPAVGLPFALLSGALTGTGVSGAAYSLLHPFYHRRAERRTFERMQEHRKRYGGIPAHLIPYERYLRQKFDPRRRTAALPAPSSA